MAKGGKKKGGKRKRTQWDDETDVPKKQRGSLEGDGDRKKRGESMFTQWKKQKQQLKQKRLVAESTIAQRKRGQYSRLKGIQDDTDEEQDDDDPREDLSDDADSASSDDDDDKPSTFNSFVSRFQRQKSSFQDEDEQGEEVDESDEGDEVEEADVSEDDVGEDGPVTMAGDEDDSDPYRQRYLKQELTVSDVDTDLTKSLASMLEAHGINFFARFLMLKHREDDDDDEDKDDGTEWQKIFKAGNNDDSFQIGVSFARKSVKLYTDYSRADLIVASPLALRQKIGDVLIDIVAGDKSSLKLPVDFLSSIEVCIREWNLNHQAHHFRQTIVLSHAPDAQLNNLFTKSCHNMRGVTRIAPIYDLQHVVPSVSHVIPSIKQIFQRLDTPSQPAACPLAKEPDARFEYFDRHILAPLLDHPSKHIMIFVPSYLDFVRLRNVFASQKRLISCAAISEYSTDAQISSGKPNKMSLSGDDSDMERETKRRRLRRGDDDSENGNASNASDLDEDVGVTPDERVYFSADDEEDDDGEDLLENAQDDYKRMDTLDQYDVGQLDDRRYDAIDEETRRRVEEELDRRDAREGRLAAVLQEDQEMERDDAHRRRFVRRQDEGATDDMVQVLLLPAIASLILRWVFRTKS
ncbi:hypothetical protein DYB32_003096 [Aphanomyces invadans]|uniref:U3 small nucleolar RNA-associated protein 25 n=1 Tax=Aphanomyces invadans TaxID=157072 RepID=A0A418B1L4_9STRA|nr:hypothetical protein DYB32_003096 [Aphanomyces invadans]